MRFLRYVFLSYMCMGALWAQHMFWEVNGTTGGKVYLLGSIHIGNESMYPLPKEIMDAYKASSYLVVELKENTPTQMALQDAMYKKGRYDDNDTIKNHIKSSTFYDLSQWVQSIGLEMKAFLSFKPWVVGLTLSQMELVKYGYSPEFGIDHYFQQKAKQDQKPIFSMESVAQQLSVLYDENNDSYSEQVLNLMIKSRAKDLNQTQRFFKAWSEGNETYFTNEVLFVSNLYPKVKENLLLKRNELMYKKVERYRRNSRGRSYFMVVGTGHLIGEDGVVAKLKDANVSVKRY